MEQSMSADLSKELFLALPEILHPLVVELASLINEASELSQQEFLTRINSFPESQANLYNWNTLLLVV